MTSTTDSKVHIRHHGQIQEMVFPPDWIADEPVPNPGLGTRSFRKVHVSGADEVAVCFFFRGLPVSDEAAGHFKAVLKKEPHLLSAEEVSSIQEILSSKMPVATDKFKLKLAKTEDLKGRRILVAEGRYLEAPEQDIREMFIDSDGSGRFVQEIYFQAPKDLFMRYLSEAHMAFKSIVWSRQQN